MTLYDLITVLILGVSLIVGLARGAIKEVANVVSFVLAIFVSLFALRYSGPIAARSVHPAWAASAIAVLIVFLAAYIVLRVIAGSLTRSVHQTRALGAIDRLIGGGFGLVRGLVLLGVIILLLGAILPPSRMPVWITNARLLGVSEVSATALRDVAPKGAAVAAELKPTMDKALNRDSSAPPASSDGGHSGDSGYSAAARKGLDDVVEKSR